MTLEEFKGILQKNITNHLDRCDTYLANDVEGIVDLTFSQFFYDSTMTGLDIVSKPLDTAPQN